MRMKTARQALEWVKTTIEADINNLSPIMVPPMVDHLVKHFDEGKGIDDRLEIK